MRGDQFTVKGSVTEKNYTISYTILFHEPNIYLGLRNEQTKKDLCECKEIAEDIIIHVEVFNSENGPKRFKRLLTQVISENILSFKHQMPETFDSLMFDKLKNSTSLRAMQRSSDLSNHEIGSEYGDHAETAVKLQGVAIASDSMYMFTLVGDTQTDVFTLTVRNNSRQKYVFRDKPVLTSLFKDHEKSDAEE